MIEKSIKKLLLDVLFILVLLAIGFALFYIVGSAIMRLRDIQASVESLMGKAFTGIAILFAGAIFAYLLQLKTRWSNNKVSLIMAFVVLGIWVATFWIK